MTPATESITTKAIIQKKNDTPIIPYYLRPNQHQRDMNTRMTDLIPVLGSTMGQIPMLRNRWYSPSEEYEPGTPCYIPTNGKSNDGKDDKLSKKSPPKQPREEKTDYVWIPKRGRKNSDHFLPEGYYHLSTQEAYVEIYHLFQQRRMRRNIFQKKTPQHKLESKIHDLLQNRLISDLPDDLHAARMRVFLLKSQGGKAKAFGRATYLPVLTSILISGSG